MKHASKLNELNSKSILAVLIIVLSLTGINLWRHSDALPVGYETFSGYGFSFEYPNRLDEHSWGYPESYNPPDMFGGTVQVKKYWDGKWENFWIRWYTLPGEPDLMDELNAHYDQMDEWECIIDEKEQLITSEFHDHEALVQSYTFIEYSGERDVEYMTASIVWSQYCSSLHANRVYVISYIAYPEHATGEQAIEKLQQYLDTFNPDTSASEEVTGCSVITCSIGDTILFGYNLDGHSNLTPFIGFGDHLEFSDGETLSFDEPLCFTGRMLATGPRDGYGVFKANGFCHAGNSLSSQPMYIDPEKRNYTQDVDGPGPAFECSSVLDAIDFFDTYNLLRSDPPEWWWQYHFADSSGKAVIVATDKDGKIGYTRLDSNYLVSTNHNLLNPNHHDGSLVESRDRYDEACELLEEITDEEELTFENIANVLEAISVESTTHSLIINPKTGEIYVYHPEDYTKPMKFNLIEELDKLEQGVTTIYNITQLYQTQKEATMETETIPSYPITAILIAITIIIHSKKQSH